MRVAAIWLLALCSGSVQVAEQVSAAQRASALRAAGKFIEARNVVEQALALHPADAGLQNEEALASERIALDAIAQHRPDDALADLLRGEKTRAGASEAPV